MAWIIFNLNPALHSTQTITGRVSVLRNVDINLSANQITPLSPVLLRERIDWLDLFMARSEPGSTRFVSRLQIMPRLYSNTGVLLKRTHWTDRQRTVRRNLLNFYIFERVLDLNCVLTFKAVIHYKISTATCHLDRWIFLCWPRNHTKQSQMSQLYSLITLNLFYVSILFKALKIVV